MAENWQDRFKQLFDAGLKAYASGVREAAKMFPTQDQVFLSSIGATPQEIFDFVEDHARFGEPEYASVLAVSEIRREYFLEVQNGIPSQFEIDPAELPAKTDKVDGIRWLPRIIAKARAKLRGELDPTTMFGCGGDRPFVQRIGMTLPEFLQLVWDAGSDDQKIVDTVKAPVAK